MNQARQEMIMWSATDPGEPWEGRGESVEKSAYFHTYKFSISTNIDHSSTSLFPWGKTWPIITWLVMTDLRMPSSHGAHPAFFAWPWREQICWRCLGLWILMLRNFNPLFISHHLHNNLSGKTNKCFPEFAVQQDLHKKEHTEGRMETDQRRM